VPPAPATIRVVVVDDHVRAREAARRFLADAGDIDVVGDAATADQGIALIPRRSPHVVLMDLNLPGKSGVEAIREIVEAGMDTRVLVLSVSEAGDDVVEAILAGASGYVVKGGVAGELARAVRATAAGDSFLSPRVASELVARWRPALRPSLGALGAEDLLLTERELDVLRLVALGKENSEIASDLVISPNTVRRHVQAILVKLGVENRTQAAVYAVREGLIEE
jgi:DNA-binding NarL/FixJ family response regulator